MTENYLKQVKKIAQIWDKFQTEDQPSDEGIITGKLLTGALNPRYRICYDNI